MHAVATPSLIARLTRRKPRVQRAPEAADLGTELGMEHWLDERDTTLALAALQQQAAAVAPASGPTSTAPATSHTARPAAHRSRRVWLPRWLLGSAAR